MRLCTKLKRANALLPVFEQLPFRKRLPNSLDVSTNIPASAATPGLTDAEVKASRQTHGRNLLEGKEKSFVWQAVREVVADPMFLLLIVAASLYFLLGRRDDGYFMLAAVLLVSTISLYQSTRTRNALKALKALTEPMSRVIRNGVEVSVPSAELVVGDVVRVSEGAYVPADAQILTAHDFSVNESVLTGESMPLSKSEEDAEPLIFQGTSVVTGAALAEVTAVGPQTRLGQIGERLDTIQVEKTPLERQIRRFVLQMVIAGGVVFVGIWVLHFYQSGDALGSLLKSLTLAMSVVPEEIPVTFTTFMALGAWRLLQLGVLVKQSQTVEALGSATVICTDKTGTITENKMVLAKLYAFATKAVQEADAPQDEAVQALLEAAMWASEPTPFDPMEQALHAAYGTSAPVDKRPSYTLVHEYPLDGKPPMMTHVFADAGGNRIVAAKGAPEALMAVSRLSDQEKAETKAAFESMAAEGFRVLGVGIARQEGDLYPKRQQDYGFQFLGLVAFFDPPRKNIGKIFRAFSEAGVRLKIITGDNAATTATLARQVGLPGTEHIVTGDALAAMDASQLAECVRETVIFARMYPEAKLRVIEALKAQGETVAMTGDGVNDGPALKAAHIGIAMGKRGSEIAKQAASLVLTDDDFGRLVDAIALGRRIYINLKKAIRYIISIHIPIILTVLIPVALGWVFPDIFLPPHVIFLELIMGPTCSIVYENEPLEQRIMHEKPRKMTETFFQVHELATSIVQGLVITLAVLSVYQYASHSGLSEQGVRSAVFLTLISANIFMTLQNRSFYYSILTTIRYRNSWVWLILGISTLFTALVFFVPAARNLFELDVLTWDQALACMGVGLVSVLWYEGVKAWKRHRTRGGASEAQD